MIRVAIACTAAATAVVAAYGLKDTTAKDWILTGIPAWLQGVGTIGAAGAALEAWLFWKHQERERRSIDKAEQLLSHLYILRSHMLSTQIGIYVNDSSPKLIDFFLKRVRGEVFGNAIQGMEKEAGEIRGQLPLADMMFGNQGHRLRKIIEELLHLQRNISIAYHSARALDNERDVDFWEISVKESLAILDVTFDGKDSTGQQEQVRQLIDDASMLLEQFLHRHVER